MSKVHPSVSAVEGKHKAELEECESTFKLGYVSGHGKTGIIPNPMGDPPSIRSRQDAAAVLS